MTWVVKYGARVNISGNDTVATNVNFIYCIRSEKTMISAVPAVGILIYIPLHCLIGEKLEKQIQGIRIGPLFKGFKIWSSIGLLYANGLPLLFLVDMASLCQKNTLI